MLTTDDNKFLIDGDGVNKEFPFSFKIFKPEDLLVYKIDKTTTPYTPHLQTLNTDYTVEISRVSDGGKVIFTTAPTLDEQVFGKRVIPLTQPTQIPTESNFPEAIVEDALDRSMMICQQLQEQINRTAMLPSYSEIQSIIVEPPVDNRAMVWQIDGDTAYIKNSNVNPDDAVAAATAEATRAAAEADRAELAAETAEAAIGVMPAAEPNTSWFRNGEGAIENMALDDFKAWHRPFILFEDKKVLRIKEGTLIRLVTDSDTRYFRQTSDLVVDVTSILDTGTTLQNGKDYYVYLVPSGATGVELKVSLNSTYPDGYTADNSRKIGGFHTECANVGVISGHPLSGWLAGDILPCSVWCLNHRPIASPEGMVYVKEIDLWVDIYLQSGKYDVSTGALTTASVYGGTVTASRPWADHAEDLFRVSKRMPTDIEFSCFAEGSNQKTTIKGSAAPNPKTAGGHVDTASRRMISNYGIEECCGYLYQWLDNPSANGGTGFTNYDSLAGAKGQVWGTSYALRAGGNWHCGASCGSRCRSADHACSYASASLGCRGVSSPKRICRIRK